MTVVFLNSGIALIAETERESKLYCSCSPIRESRTYLNLMTEVLKPAPWKSRRPGANEIRQLDLLRPRVS